MTFSISIAVAILYDPAIAATIALLGSFDAREFRGQIGVLRALFNRSQLALSVLVVAKIFQSIAGIRSPWYLLMMATLVAIAIGYAMNVVTVSIHAAIEYSVSPQSIIRRLRIGGLPEFLISYVGLGIFGAVVARLYFDAGPLSVVTVLAPLLFARQMFFRSMALEEAGKELKVREEVLRRLSNQMATERQEERMQIAAYLHDDLAQTLFRLNLQIEVAKKRLAKGDVTSVGKDLDKMTVMKRQTSDMIRGLIKDLHRSPIGRAGLAEAIQSFGTDITSGSNVRIATDVAEVSLPPPIQLLIYQIAREAAMNALKHAEPSHLWISLSETDDGVSLQIRDDGAGFDTSLPGPEGHYGREIMRERAQVVGGTFSIESEIGRGTVVAATFPKVWVEEGSRLEAAETKTPPRVTEESGPGSSVMFRPPGQEPGPPPGPPAPQEGQPG